MFKTIHDHLSIETGDIPFIDEMVEKYGVYLQEFSGDSKTRLAYEILNNLDNQVSSDEDIKEITRESLKLPKHHQLALAEVLITQLRAGLFEG